MKKEIIRKFRTTWRKQLFQGEPWYEPFAGKEYLALRKTLGAREAVIEMLVNRFPALKIDRAKTTESVYITLPGAIEKIRLSGHKQYGSQQPCHLMPKNFSGINVAEKLNTAILAAYTGARNYAHIPSFAQYERMNRLADYIYQRAVKNQTVKLNIAGSILQLTADQIWRQQINNNLGVNQKKEDERWKSLTQKKKP